MTPVATPRDALRAAARAAPGEPALVGDRGTLTWAELADRAQRARLNAYALHFAFVDPYSLGVLDFDILRKLAKLRRMDMLIHVSVQDLDRNLRKYIAKANSSLDSFAPAGERA